MAETNKSKQKEEDSIMKENTNPKRTPTQKTSVEPKVLSSIQ